MRIKLFLLFPLTFLSSSYIHAEDISENENCKVLDKCICTIRPKNSNFCISIYESDVENLASYYNMTGNYTDKEDIFDDVFKHKIAMLFGKKLGKEESEMLTKQIDNQIGLQMNNILDQCNGDEEVFQKQIGNYSLKDYENKIKKTQIENFMYQRFMDSINKKENFSIDEIREYYEEKKKNGTLRKIPEKYIVWEIKIKTHDYGKAEKVSKFLSENEWNISALKNEIQDIEAREINDKYDNERSIFPQNVRDIIFKMKKNEISSTIKTAKGLFIIKKIGDDGIMDFRCEYVFIPDKKKEEYKKDITAFWNFLLEKIKKRKDIEDTLSQVSIFIKNNPKRSERIFKNFEMVITKIDDMKSIKSKKKIFEKLNEGDFTDLFQLSNDGFYTCYYLAKKIKEHIENLDDDFNSIENQMKALWEEKESVNLIKACLKKCEISYDEEVGYTKILKKYL